MRVERDGDRWAVAGSWYRLSGTTNGPVAILADDGGRWAELRLLASADTRGGEDETFDVVGPTVDEDAAAGAVGLAWDLESSAWPTKRLTIDADDATLAVRVTVDAGTGPRDLTTVSLLSGRVVGPRASGLLMSGAWFASLVPGGPGDPGRIVQSAAESTSIGVASGSEPGRGRWFFTPGPFVFAAARPEPDDVQVLPAGPWLSFAIDAVAGQAGFTEVAWRADGRGFGIVLDYDGHTPAAGEWTSPPLVIGRARDPYEAIAAQRERLARPGAPDGTAAPPPARMRSRSTPTWWREPIFCGWGAQCADAARAGRPMSEARGLATQANYDRWLGVLEASGVVPGTIVLDDKWQARYGTNEPDLSKWPDLAGWIRARHEQGQRVLLWYKAWDPEGLPPEACVRTTAGTPIGLDPTHPAGEAAIRSSVREMLGPAGLDADGLKIDLTARTPTGRATVHHGSAWGVDLLVRLFAILADEARAAKPDALLVGQTPNVVVAPTVGMIRLNDALRLDDPRPDVDIVPQMRHRAAIAAAACPDHLIDTDDWCMPDRATWRAYAAMKAELGVPALYYATHIDRDGAPLEASDYRLIRDTWSAYRERIGLPARP